MKKTVSGAWLREQGACFDQVDLFQTTFGYAEVPITREGLVRAASIGLNLGWLAENVGLSAPAEKAYQEVKDPAWKADQEATALALRDAVGQA